MDALLASLPGAEDPKRKAPGEGSMLGSDDGQSLISSGGLLDDCDSDNGVSHLLKGGDSLSALKQGATSRLTNSASSRRSRPSTSVSPGSRQSIASRGRPLKPHEVNPFLSVVTSSPRAPTSARSGAAVPIISVVDSDGSKNYSLRPASAEVTSDFRTPIDYSALSDTGRRDSPSREDPSPRPSLKPPTPRATDNFLVKSPFKQSSPRTAWNQPSPPQPGHFLRERTTSATSRVKDQINRQGAETKKKVAGKLLKGRLKPMRPVTVAGPPIENCRGIVRDRRSYGPSPSSSRGRSDYVFDSILREYSRRDKEGTESIHHTSVASSETEERLVDSDLGHGSFDPIAEVYVVNGNADVSGAGTGTDNPSGIKYFVKERPKTAAGKSSLKVTDTSSSGRPVSASVLENGPGKAAKNVHFWDNSKNVNDNAQNNSLNLHLDLHIDKFSKETENSKACVESKEMKHKTETELTDEDDCAGDLDPKKSKISRSSCKSFDCYLTGDGDEDDSDEGEKDMRKTRTFSGVKNNTAESRTNNFTGNSTTNFVSSSSGGTQPTYQNCCDNSEDTCGDILADTICKTVSESGRSRNGLKDSCEDSGQFSERRTSCFRVNGAADPKQSPNNPGFPETEQFVLEKTHVFNFVASQLNSRTGNRHGIHASHISAEYNMSPRGRVTSPLVSSRSEPVPTLTFESLEAEISSVQNDIRQFFENKAEMDELETHREHNLDDLVVNEKKNKTVIVVDIEREITTDSSDLSDSEDEEVAVITVDSEDDEIAESLYTGAQYSTALLSGELIEKQWESENSSAKSHTHEPCSHKKRSTRSSKYRKESGIEGETGLSEYSLMGQMASETRSDSGCGSEVMSVSHGDDASCHGDFLADDFDQEAKMFGSKNKKNLNGKGAEDSRTAREKDVSSLKVVATTKDLLKLRKDKSSPILSAQHPPLCFRINARPPSGKLYYFAYGTDMNPDRLSTYINREVEARLWGVLYGFRICFNKRGIDVEAGGFPNIELDRESSVEGCLYLLTPHELERLDKSVGYPKHYEHVMFPVWMSNCGDPDNYGVAQYCVPALMYIAQDDWLETGSSMHSDYAVSQCLKAGDLLTPAYREFLCSSQSVET